MKINKHLEAIIITFLYLTCLYFWTLPIQENPAPYGEVDAGSHYAIADYTAYKDKSITSLPYYLDKRYGADNRFKPHSLWYPPPYHAALAIAAVLGGESDIPIFLANAIFSSLIILGVYFLIRKFFGFEAALVSSFILIFSLRDIMVYIWGQWPERMGFAYIPLILYCFYKYCVSYLNKEEKPIYIYIMALLLAINFFIHPMDFFHYVAALLITSIFFLIKEKKQFFNIKRVFTSLILFLLVISLFPLQTMNVVVTAENTDQTDAWDISRLFYWFKMPSQDTGTPLTYFSYKEVVAPYWTIPLIFLGILFLILRRNKKDLVMLGWLVSLYIMIHLDFIGKGRVHRSLSGTAHIFYPLMVLGILYLPSMIQALKQYKHQIKRLALVLFVILMFVSIGINANTSLKGAYLGISRVNPAQYELTKWLKLNTPEDSDMYHIGSISQQKTRWIRTISQRYTVENRYDERNKTHVIVDYSDFMLIKDQNNINKIQKWEEQHMINSTLIYDKNFIKVYKLET